ncbi:2-dehydropantoate 2-reductase [Allomesorhizobium camelthorni]|uniref:2-dehydropantoate 2-reductase n=1 Tax=Allomesorhizobium camelthorni TaxID=475069 RepID=A0A6G4WP14_9HYPH|nr:2-dehydropantoate 2-reductase [Mesorhizobium camelthorni]NGO55807.1 2-dehydropantoate 2-reductase [Mesorhizobium camelthorni]
MKICIYGAGAIGGYLGAALDEAGCEVSLIARGAHLETIRRDGLRLLKGEQETAHRLACTDRPQDLAPQDYVIVALKAHQIPDVAGSIAALLAPEGSVVTAANGLPWWYFFGAGGELEGTRLESVDPGGVQWETIGPERAIGCVVYPACEIAEPGVVRLIEGDRFTLGEPSGEPSSRVSALSDAMRKGGLKAPVRPRIREEIWIKLWGNLSFNPISALTLATLETICRDAGTRNVARSMMLEAQQIAERLGVRFPIDVDRRIAGAEAVGAHKTSMLQDLEHGRPMEIEALVGSVQELGLIAGIGTPSIDLVLALLRLRAKTLAVS